jgi:hypothetical protein
VGHFCPPGSGFRIGTGSSDLIESGSETLLVLFYFVTTFFSSTAITERISSLLSLFPLAEVTVERVLISTPELLRYNPIKIQVTVVELPKFRTQKFKKSMKIWQVQNIFPILSVLRIWKFIFIINKIFLTFVTKSKP